MGSFGQRTVTTSEPAACSDAAISVCTESEDICTPPVPEMKFPEPIYTRMVTNHRTGMTQMDFALTVRMIKYTGTTSRGSSGLTLIPTAARRRISSTPSQELIATAITKATIPDGEMPAESIKTSTRMKEMGAQANNHAKVLS